uniref:BPTI/Kunitz inhibitor domain-containing protein n=1 Tax=Panagrellus redivivus TaxID=6233 RepID=A0A7E4ZX48_PANRE
MWLLFAVINVMLHLVASGAKPMLTVPFFAMRKHSSSSRPTVFGGFSDIGAGGMSFGSKMSAGNKIVPVYAGLPDDSGSNVTGKLFPPTVPPPIIQLLSNPRPELPFFAKPAPMSSSNHRSSYQKQKNYRTKYNRVDHILPATRYRLSPRCFYDPPTVARPVPKGAKRSLITFYSFTPSAQLCEKFYVSRFSDAVGPNVYDSLLDCQIDCCPSPLCRTMG